jgi:hypothetical protein
MKIRLYVNLIILFAIWSCSSSKNVISTVSDDRDGQQIESESSTEERDGLSFESAIIVKSIKEEYSWINEKYPNSTINGQALVRNGNKPFDVITFTTPEGIIVKAHFDISSFYGKRF